MDTSKHFYFVVLRSCKTGDTVSRLDGVDFHGGLSSLTLNRLTKEIWLVDQFGQHRLTGKLVPVHQKGTGNVLLLSEQQISTFPCLLTNDPEILWELSGAVKAKTNDSSFDATALPDFGIPLCGKSWLGILRSRNAELWLDAYSTGGKWQGDIVSAFCPDWTDGFDDHDALIFTVEKKGIRHSSSNTAYA